MDQISNRTSKLSAETDIIEGVLISRYKYYVANSLHDICSDTFTQGVVKAAARWLSFPEARQSLLLTGDYGNGKSTLANSICDTYKILSGRAPLRISAVQIADFYADGLTAYEQQQNRSKLEQLLKAYIVFIDDVGKESKIKSWGSEKHPIEWIISERYKSRRTTILTSNFAMTEFETLYGKYIQERMKETYNTIEFRHPSYR